MFRNLVLTGEPAKGNFNKKEKQKAENITGGKENTEKEYGQIFWGGFFHKRKQKNMWWSEEIYYGCVLVRIILVVCENEVICKQEGRIPGGLSLQK